MRGENQAKGKRLEAPAGGGANGPGPVVPGRQPGAGARSFTTVNFIAGDIRNAGQGFDGILAQGPGGFGAVEACDQHI